MMKNEQWFTDHIGKKIMAHNHNANFYSGEMEVKDASHAAHLYHIAQKTQGYRFVEYTDIQTEFIHHYIGCSCVITIDGVPSGDIAPLTKTMLFDQIQQKVEYGRDVVIKPILRKLQAITESEMQEMEGNDPTLTIPREPQRREQWKCFTPLVTMYLLKKGFDLFELIEKGQAINADKIQKWV